MWENFKAKLITDLCDFWKLWSVWFQGASTLIIGLLTLVPSMPEEIQQAIPAAYRWAAIAVWAVLGLYIRARKQANLTKPAPDDTP